MFSRKLTICMCILFILTLMACSSNVRQANPPELLTPLSNRIDIAVVTRGDVEEIVQHGGIIRVSSEEVNFGATQLPFDVFHVLVGERVVEGQLIASLNVEHIEEELRNMLDQVSTLQDDHEFENNMIRSEISILWAERNELIASEAESVLINLKSVDIEQKQMELDHVYERHTLTMNVLNGQVDILNEQLANAELRAPYDGIITWLAPLSHGEFLYPFQGIAFISDEEDIFIEYASSGPLTPSIRNESVVKALVGGTTYELAVRELSSEVISRYIANSLNPPRRFEIANPEHNLTPGVPVVIRHYISSSYDTLMIPVNTVFSVGGAAYVYINSNGRREKRYIQVGVRNKALVEVLDGLEEGDEVFVR